MISWVFIIGVFVVWVWNLFGVFQDYGLKWIYGDVQYVECIFKEDFGILDDLIIVVYEKQIGIFLVEFWKWVNRYLQEVVMLFYILILIFLFEVGRSVMMWDDMVYVFLDFNVLVYWMNVFIEQFCLLNIVDD